METMFQRRAEPGLCIGPFERCSPQAHDSLRFLQGLGQVIRLMQQQTEERQVKGAVGKGKRFGQPFLEDDSRNQLACCCQHAWVHIDSGHFAASLQERLAEEPGASPYVKHRMDIYSTEREADNSLDLKAGYTLG